MARMGEIQIRGDGSDPRQIMNYLYQLEEQIRYALSHIGSENIVAGSIGQELLAPPVKKTIQNIEINVEAQQRVSRQLKSEDGKIRTLITETEAGIMRQMEDETERLETTITETAAGIRAEVQRLDTDKIAKTEAFQTAESIYSAAVAQAAADAGSSYLLKTEFSQTAEAIGLSARGIDLEQATGEPVIRGSHFTISAEGIAVNSTGALTVNTSNFTLDAQGAATFGGTLSSPTGNFGGMTVNRFGMYRADQCVRLLAQNGDFGAEWTMHIEEPTAYDPITQEPEDWAVSPSRAISVRARTFYPQDRHVTMNDVKVEALLEASEAELSTAKIDRILLKNPGTGSYEDVTSAILALL